VILKKKCKQEVIGVSGLNSVHLISIPISTFKLEVEIGIAN